MPALFDGGCFVGQAMGEAEPFTADDLLRSLDENGTSTALVGSYRSLYCDVKAGNREVAQLAAKHPLRIVPLGILHPARYDETPAQQLAWLKQELGIRVAALFSLPSYYPVVWDSPWMVELGRAAESLGVVLQAGIRDDAELAAVGRVWGGLKTPVLIRWMAGHRYRMHGQEHAAARACPNFYFDVGNACSTGAIARLAETIGADRLFFASSTPLNLPASPHAVLAEAELSDEDRAAISGGTLAKLLNFTATSQAPSPAAASRQQLWAKLKSRPKFDTHWHPDHWNLGEPATDLASQQRTWTEFGIERVLVFSIEAINYDLDAGNRQTERVLAADPRAVGLIVVNPLQPQASLAQIERLAAHPRFVGVKTIQDNYGLGLDHAAYEPLLAEAAKHDLPVLAHLTGLEGAARKFPTVRFVGAHGNWGRTHRLRALPNVWFDFSTSHALAEETQLARFIRETGAHRILFGSDGQLVSPAWSLAKLLDCGLSDAEFDLILRRNAEVVFPKAKSQLSGVTGRASH